MIFGMSPGTLAAMLIVAAVVVPTVGNMVIMGPEAWVVKTQAGLRWPKRLVRARFYQGRHSPRGLAHEALCQQWPWLR